MLSSGGLVQHLAPYRLFITVEPQDCQTICTSHHAMVSFCEVLTSQPVGADSFVVFPYKVCITHDACIHSLVTKGLCMMSAYEHFLIRGERKADGHRFDAAPAFAFEFVLQVGLAGGPSQPEVP